MLNDDFKCALYCFIFHDVGLKPFLKRCFLNLSIPKCSPTETIHQKIGASGPIVQRAYRCAATQKELNASRVSTDVIIVYPTAPTYII